MLNLFKRPSTKIYGISIIIIAGMTQYSIPLVLNQNVKFYHIGLFLYLFLYISQIIIKNQKYIKGDRKIWIAVLFFYFFLSISYILGEVKLYNPLTYIYRLADYSLLFFITIFSIKTKKDISILINSIIISVIIISFIGLGQFYTGDSNWGELGSETSKEIFVGAYSSAPDDNSGIWRIASTTNSPNGLGAVLVLVLPLIFYKYFASIKSNYKLWWGSVIIFLLFILLLSGARTAWMALVIISIIFLIFNIGYEINIKKKINIFLLLLLIIPTITLIPYNEIITARITERYESIDMANKISASLEAGRFHKWTKSWEGNSEFSLLAIGHGWNHRPSTAQPHNSYLSTLFLSGIWGLISYIFLLSRSILIAIKYRRDILYYSLFLSLFAYFFMGFSYENILNSTVFIFWPLIAIIAKRKIWFGKNQTNNNLQKKMV